MLADHGFGTAAALLLLCANLALAAGDDAGVPTVKTSEKAGRTLNLPAPRTDSDVSIESALLQRRSVRSFTSRPLTAGEVSQLLWAAQGITHGEGFRTAPSAGALYPLEIYVLLASDAFPPGVYHYMPLTRQLRLLNAGEHRPELADSAFGQAWVEDNGGLLVIAAVSERTRRKYGGAAQRYVDIEVGHAAQNVALQAVALGLGSAVVGAFDEARAAAILGLPQGQRPLYLMPLGTPR